MPVKVAHTTTGDSVGPRTKFYKHSLRKTPYYASLAFLVAATTLTLLALYSVDWIHQTVTQPGPIAFETKYGLYQRCTRKTQSPNSTLLAPSHPLPDPVFVNLISSVSIDEFEIGPADGEGDGWQCQEFPSRSECAEFGEKFCVLWSSAGYAAQLSLVPCLAALLSLLFIFLFRGDRSRRARARRHSWKLVSGAMLVHTCLQILSFSLIIHVWRTDERFEPRHTRLDTSFYFGLTSSVVSGLCAVLLTFTGLAAKRGKSWAAGTSARKARMHKRTKSGRVVPIRPGEAIPRAQRVPIGEVEAVIGPEPAADERTALLEGNDGSAAGGSGQRATDSTV